MNNTHIKSERNFQIFANFIMIIVTLCSIIPLILLLISSLTDDSALIRNGYSFIPESRPGALNPPLT